MKLKVKRDKEIRTDIMVPVSVKLSFKKKVAELGNKLGRNVTQVEALELYEKIPLKVLTEVHGNQLRVIES